jgi:hypothetical protein
VKQKDVALVLVMTFVSAVAALVLSRVLFSTPQNRNQTAEVVDVISSDFALPSTKYYNLDSVNPTQQIQIGGDSNPNPFNSDSR